ncbi:MAG: hypothetical protein MUD16_09660 [Desulfobacterales bacterium]|nr:hypothetical protein [Desulfobacterales bacterium]
MQPKTIEEVKQAHEAGLMAIEHVEGVGIGADSAGREVIVVYISDPDAAARLPKQIEGFRLRIENLGGPIEAYPE